MPETVSVKPDRVAEMGDLVRRRQKRDRSVMPRARELLKDPDLAETIGNLALQAQESIINGIMGDNLVSSHALRVKLAAMRADLELPNPSPIERLLVERVVACWLQVQEADLCWAQAQECSLVQGEDVQRRMDHAHRRYLSAIKALALVRKLALPVLQVSIAHKQVNMAAPGGRDS